MKRYSFVVVLFFLSVLSASTQILNPVKWTYVTEKTTEGYYNVVFTAKIDKNWHLYGVNIPEGGPVATSFTFNPSGDYELVGKIKEISKGEEKFDESFQMNVKMFTTSAKFIQKIKLKNGGNVNISGTIEFMCCDNSKCSPPKNEEFKLTVSPKLVEEGSVEQKKVAENSGVSSDTIAEKGTFQSDSKDSDSSRIAQTAVLSTDNKDKDTDTGSLWSFILLAFAAGIAGVFTPCVYPMLPLTVSFFMRGEQKRTGGIRNGLIFGLSIIFIYTMLGVILALTKSGTTVTNFIATNWIANLVFFGLFLVFALWFFGLFEIVLPGSISNKLDQKADRGGMIGAFFMALTLIIVSFSCTGPFIGAILVESTSGLAIKPVVGMFTYSFAFALPFVILAISPELMKKMSRSGSWLNTVKVVFAFILLAFALKFLSVIDTTNHLNLLPREVFLSIWIVIYGMLGLYLIGKIKFPHDGDLPYIPVPRFILAVLVFSFVVYMIPGLFGADLKLINALLPPASKNTSFISSSGTSENKGNYLCGTPKYSDFLSLPYGLQGYFELNEGLACAKQKNKPVFLDIKGHACANCKKMEGKVFSDFRVQQKLQNDFVIIALYVDDKYTLPESEWLKLPDGKEVKTNMGERNLDIEIKKFGINTQPLYAILDAKGDTLGKPMETNLDPDAFLKFLEEGKAKFNR